MKVVGLFAGVGGIEYGLQLAGHRSILLCENDPAAIAVLHERFDVPVRHDVRELRRLPPETEFLTAGFPCQDLSQAGPTLGLDGEQSGLVSHVFRLLRRKRVPWVLLENVPFMLRLRGGSAMLRICDELESLGYRWAYRVLDARAFGLPQRRERVFLLASTAADPAAVLFEGNEDPSWTAKETCRAYGFYWTEGNRGLGWAGDHVPTLKGGSRLGIPSPPAIWRPENRDIVVPDIRDAERLQGFPADWTKPAERVGRSSIRWRLVGNAVTVAVAEWIGRRLNIPKLGDWQGPTRPRGIAWSAAGLGAPRAGRFDVPDLTPRPVKRSWTPLLQFLKHDPRPLSARATTGFLGRLRSSRLRYPPDFAEDLQRHAEIRKRLASRLGYRAADP